MRSRVFACFLLLATACAGPGKVTRLDDNSVVDLSGKWNDTDSRLVSSEMIADLLGSAGFLELGNRLNRAPAIIVGTVVNKSHEHIDVATFTRDIERAITNSGKARFVASRSERGELRRERADQMTNASDDTKKDFGQERGADLMLKGEINSTVDESQKRTLVVYQVGMFLIDLETNDKTWIGDKTIKKVLEQ